MTNGVATKGAGTATAAIRPQRKIAAIPMLEALLLALFLVLPAFLPDYLTVFATRLLILAFLALSFDLVWGYAGILSAIPALPPGSCSYAVTLVGWAPGTTATFI